MTEQEQVQAIIDGAQSIADNLSSKNEHVAALRVVGLAQLVRALWTRLNPPGPPAEPSP